MLHPSQKDDLLNLARYMVIAYAGNYGIRVHASPECLAALLAADAMGKILIKNGDILEIRGCPTQEILAAFSDLRFHKGQGSLWTVTSGDGLRIDQVHKNADNIVLLNGSTFYSGVLLKPLRFSYLKNCYENYFLMPQCSITWLPEIGLQRYLWHWRL